MAPFAAATKDSLRPDAVRRLQRDLQAWERDSASLQLPVAVGFGADLSQMFINFRPGEGPYKDQTIHIHATFPPDYPSSPPDVRMMTPGFRHPNVFAGFSNPGGGAYICLDMIKPPESHSLPYSGWSAAYDMSGLVLQLYSFLLGDDNIDQEYGGSVSRAKYARGEPPPPADFKCHCGFCELPSARSPPHPAQPAPSASPGSSASAPAAPEARQREASAPSSSLPELPEDLVGLIVSKVDPGTLTVIAAEAGSRGAGRCGSSAAERLADIALRAKQDQELVCFYHKTRDVVLGFGVSIIRYRDGGLKELSMAMDLLSYSAFQGGVRRSAWNIPFEAFLPLALNPEHATRSLAVLDSCVAQMLGRGGSGAGPDQVLEVMARLMNSLVVQIVTKPASGAGATSTSGAGLARHMSDAALKGFCHLHHLILTVVLSRHPGLIARCQADVLLFVERLAARHKSRCPDLGLLLIKYMLVPRDVVPWADFAPAFMRELLARQVMWVGRALGSGGAGFLAPWAAPDTLQQRLETHFAHSRTSLATVAVEAFFVNTLARPDTTDGAVEQLRGIKDTYDSRNGEPPASVFDAFSRHARSVLSLSKWTDVLSMLRMGIRPPALPEGGQPTVGDMARQMADTLRQAAVDSMAAGYHKDSYPGRSATQFVDWATAPPLGAVSGGW